ncbi:MAG: phage protease [Gammaproteobacteria bacterium]|nr:phage protease [Gammaproteobacteria bacterium]
MKKTLSHIKSTLQLNQGLAVLTAAPVEFGFAACTVDYSKPNEIQLLPAGFFKAVIDARPTDVPGGHWFIDRAIAERVIAKVAGRNNQLVIDYEHQTLNASDNGKPAPAAGWFRNIEWREGAGLFATDVQWTATAKAHIKAGEYRFISAVFPYNKQTGAVEDLYLAALTNQPGLDGMESVTALSSSMAKQIQSSTSQIQTNSQGEKPMNEAFKLLLSLVGVDVGDTDLTDAAALTALNDKAKVNIAALKADAGKVNDLSTQIAALKAKPNSGEPDPAQYVPVGVVKEMQTQIAALTSQANGSSVDTLIKEGLDNGRLLPAMEAWARTLGDTDVASLKSFLDTAEPIAALSAQQSKGKAPVVDDKTGLTSDQLAVCKATGISVEDFKANLESE